jgi:D-amino-acid dehydrogenase
MLGLSTAWFLQEHGVAVTVFERTAVAAGASWGNAGWVTPGLAAPLPEPAMLRAGLRALAARDSPLSIPLRADAGLLAFLGGFTRNCTARRWQAAMASLVPLSRRAISAFDALAAGGVQAVLTEARPLLAGFATPAQRQPMLAELGHIRDCGAEVEFDLLDGAAIQRLEPALSGSVRAAIRLHGQRYIDPGAFTAALADSVRRRGGIVREGTGVTGLHADPAGLVLRHGPPRAGPRADGAGARPGHAAGESRHDAVVLATGAWLGDLARAAGVRMRVQSGRGYSCSVPVRLLPAGPVYFPAARLACTPMPDGLLRLAGMMEFRAPGGPPDPRRFALIAAAVRPLLPGADVDRRTSEWVGARPCTPDGLPLIGRTRSPRIFVAGGHAMYGITLGPATGQLLAQAVISGSCPPELTPFNPLR